MYESIFDFLLIYMKVKQEIKDRIQSKNQVKQHLVYWCYPTHPFVI